MGGVFSYDNSQTNNQVRHLSPREEYDLKKSRPQPPRGRSRNGSNRNSNNTHDDVVGQLIQPRADGSRYTNEEIIGVVTGTYSTGSFDDITPRESLMVIKGLKERISHYNDVCESKAALETMDSWEDSVLTHHRNLTDYIERERSNIQIAKGIVTQLCPDEPEF